VPPTHLPLRRAAAILSLVLSWSVFLGSSLADWQQFAMVVRAAD
jgi:hypothetical protein